MASEAKITINRQPPADGATAPMTDAAAANAQRRNEVQQRRKQIHQQAAHDRHQSTVPTEPEAPPEPPPIREDIETIEFTAPNGMLIEYGPRQDISLMARIARIYAGRNPGITEYRLARILMGIRAINGVAPITIVDEVTRDKLANQVGDETIDILMWYDQKHWPPLTDSELPLVKKKLRM